MKQGVKALLWTVGVLAALLLAVSLAGGPLAKSYLNRHGEQLAGRKVQVGNVGLNLFTGHVYVRQLTLFEDDGTTPFAGFDTLDMRLHLLQLPFRTVNLRHLTLSGLQANLLQQGDRFNFSSLIDHFKSDDDEQDSTPSRWTVKMHNLRLSHASLYYNDLLSRKELSLPDINLRVPGFTIGGKERSEGGLTLGFAEGGTLHIDAHYDATLERYDMQAQLGDFALENVQELVADMVNIDRLRGNMQATLRADGETRHLLNSHIDGSIAIDQLDMRTEHSTLATLKTLAVDINNINLDKKSFDLQRVALDGLELAYERWNDHNTLGDMRPARPDTVEKTTPQTPAKPLSLSIGELQLTDCAFLYTDHTLPDRFYFPVTGINLSANNISTRGANNARLRAALPGGGHLSLRWQGMLGQWKNFQDLFLTVKGLDMKQLNPLVVAYTGRPFKDGIFGLSTHLAINNSQLRNDNHIDIYKASVGKKRKDVHPEKNIPLKSALYVLKDKDDKILLDVPVKGNVDSPEFNYMKLVWKTLGNLLVKVATSPARALGNALGLNGTDLEFIAITPGQHTLGSEQYHSLSQLASLAKDNPQVVLVLGHSGLPAADSITIERLDHQVLSYLTEQGLDEMRVVITDNEQPDGKGRIGYAVSSELIIEEE